MDNEGWELCKWGREIGQWGQKIGKNKNSNCIYFITWYVVHLLQGVTSHLQHKNQIHRKILFQKLIVYKHPKQKNYRKRKPESISRGSTICNTGNEASVLLHFVSVQLLINKIWHISESERSDYWVGEFHWGPLVPRQWHWSIDWLIDYWGLTPEQKYFSYNLAMNMKWIIKWTWNDNDDEMKKGMGHKKNRVDKFWLSQKGRDG